MIYASELIEAVQKGGLNNWATTTGKNNVKQLHTKRKADAENAIQELLSAMHKGNWTVPKLQVATGMSRDSIYSRLATLIERGKVKREKDKGVFQYYRV